MLTERPRPSFDNPVHKDCWHLYGLQHLSPNRFAKVVGKILKGHHDLIVTRERSTDVVFKAFTNEA